ncbi:DUF779 domain-containing protein [Streptomyces orinoci]|uniref:DUF779 domain-containing protein n=1 Tax=Streptomyces orinoci TaxID=67339 RepID=A0ABV3K5E2_STRON|nr:DUF779 domain-containing protein [Streptomyces orinoci]
MKEPATARVALTEDAAGLIRALYTAHGPLMFHQSGGCCDGSSPMCYRRGEFRTGGSDVLLAELAVDGLPEPVGFWMSAEQFERWRHTRLTVDVVPGRGSGFSLEAPEGVRFLIRSRLLTDAERALLDAAQEEASARERACRRSGGPGRA